MFSESSILYKYLPPDRITYFSNELLRFTQPADLNDPFECIPIVSVDDTHAVAEEYVRLVSAEAETKTTR